MIMSCPHCRRTFEALATLHAKGLLAIGENVLVQVHHAASGKLLEQQEIHNMVTDSGLQFIRDLIDETQQGCTHFATGTDLSPTVAGHTTLGAEVYRNAISAREKVDFEITQRCFIAPSAANGNTLYEAGLFNGADATAGQSTLFSRVVHDAIVKTISNTVTYAWTHTIGRA